MKRLAFPLHVKILLGLLAGAVLGTTLKETNLLGENLHWISYNITEPLGQLFLRLLLLLVIPMVFSSLVAGIAGIGDIRRLGKIGLRCLFFTIIVSGCAVLIGIVLSNLIQPGHRISPELSQMLSAEFAGAAGKEVENALAAAKQKDSPLMQAVKMIVPTNIFASISRDPPDMLGLMMFSVFLGVMMTLTKKAEGLRQLLEGLYDVIAKGVDVVMKIAPYAVFCLIFTMTSRFGAGMLKSLGWFVGTVLLGLSIQMFVVYPAVLLGLARKNPIAFFRNVRLVMATAFSTASSNATLPTALKVAEENLHIPRDINTFVLTVGATANQNGTALYEGATVLFLSQLAGIDLSLQQQLLVVFLAILGGVGTAGVPSGSIPFIIMILASIGVNPALIAVILGVDRILDMCRTVLNVTGDLAMAVYVTEAEKPGRV